MNMQGGKIPCATRSNLRMQIDRLWLNFHSTKCNTLVRWLVGLSWLSMRTAVSLNWFSNTGIGVIRILELLLLLLNSECCRCYGFLRASIAFSTIHLWWIFKHTLRIHLEKKKEKNEKKERKMKSKITHYKSEQYLNAWMRQAIKFRRQWQATTDFYADFNRFCLKIHL